MDSTKPCSSLPFPFFTDQDVSRFTAGKVTGRHRIPVIYRRSTGAHAERVPGQDGAMTSMSKGLRSAAGPMPECIKTDGLPQVPPEGVTSSRSYSVSTNPQHDESAESSWVTWRG